MKTIYQKLLFLWLLLPFSVLAQSTLQGTVVDKNSKQPIPGVNVVVQGASSGAQTDFDGKFQLPVNKGDVVVFSYLGYTNYSITYNGQNNLTVSLEESSNQLSEVVVQVGYGSVKKKDATGSVATVTAKDFNRGMNATAENLLNGRVAGLSITTTGAPGAGSTIRIRGGASLNASNDPLIVIDGLPIDNKVSGGSTSVLSSINPNDIESISILKDASASSIYGSRASNGVIIITTKKGSKGDLQVSFNSLTTMNTLAKKVDVLSADQFRWVVAVKGTDAQKALLGEANTDWQDEIFQNSISTDNNVSVRGNLLKVVPARLAVGYTNIPGLLKTGEFKRTTTSLSLNPSLFDDHLKVNVNANISWQDNRFAEEGAIGNAIHFDPTQSVYDPNSYFGGYFEWLEADGDRVAVGAQQNPVSMLDSRRNVTDNRRIYGNVQVDYKLHFFPDLRAVVNVGLDKQDGTGTNTLQPYTPAGYITGSFSGGNYLNLGSFTHFWDEKENKLLDAYLVYTKQLGKLNLDVTGGYSYQNFTKVAFTTNNVYNPNQTPDVTTDPEVNLQSYFGRMNLNYNNRYLLTLNYRRDGTSRFSEDNRWGDFPGAAFAWRISEEGFLKNIKTISELKLRLGWGVTGQQDIEDGYAYIPRYTTGNTQAQYQFGNVFVPVGRPQGYNTGLKWEETTTKNIGLDYGFFDGRLTGSLDFYEKKTEDLLAKVPYPDGANLSNEGFTNFGDFTSKGVEFSISYDILKGEKFSWNASFNAAYNDQEITSLANETDIAVGDIDGGGGNKIQVHTEGYNPFSFYVYEQVYDAAGMPLEGVYVDRNQDGVITAADKYRYQKPTADYTFGLMNNLSYKAFDFSMAWRASVGNYMYNNASSNSAYLLAGVRYNDVLSNIDSNYLSTGFVTENNRLSDYYIQNASWLKLDNVTLGYTMMDPLGFKKSKLRIYGAVQNVLTITDYDGVDPEIFGGIDKTIYPRARMYMLGINLDF